MSQRGIHLWVLPCAWVVAASAETAPWPVTGATHRIELEIVREPSQPEAGIVAIVPDGGILPGPAIQAEVLDEQGVRLAAGVIWHNPKEGAAICFEPPRTSRRVTAYLRSVPKGEPWSTAVRSLKPSLLMFTAPGGAQPSLNQAHDLARETPPGRKARMALVPIIGQMENRLGSDDHYVSWYTGWLKIEQPGRYYFCTICDEGSEVRVDGRTIVKITGRNRRADGAKGQWGDWIELDRGLHQVEYWHYEIDGPQEAHLAWRVPGDKSELPVTVPATAWVRSGEAVVRQGTDRAGQPLPLWEWEVSAYIWTAEKPLNVYSFQAMVPDDLVSGGRLSWTCDRKPIATGTSWQWFWEDEGPHEVSLTLGRGPLAPTARREVLLPYNPRRLEPSRADDRRAARAAFESRLKSVPPERRPCADWTPNMWATLVDFLELYRSGDIPTWIVERSRPDLLKQPIDIRDRIETLYVESLRIKDPLAAVQWLATVIREEPNASIRMRRAVERARILAWDLGLTNEARTVLQEVRTLATDAESSIRWLVGAGDVERAARQRAEAARLYASAQDRSREYQKTAAQVATVQRLAATNRTLAARLAGDWRVAAVREGQFYVTVDNLLRQEAWDDARQTLDQWELELPTSKLDGDFPLAEAQFYLAVGDARRALKILQTYRQMVDINSQLYKAMQLERRCLIALDMRKELDELVREMERRFPGSDRSRSTSSSDATPVRPRHGRERTP